MNDYCDFDKLTLTLYENKISSIVDNTNGNVLKFFHKRLAKKNTSKIYIIKEDNQFLYIGMTTQPLSTRFRYGFKADGRNGYHEYQWRTKESVQLYVWCFEELDKKQIENIEAELAFLIRKKTGKWPLNQTEIHFNNDFDRGKEIAKMILFHLE